MFGYDNLKRLQVMFDAVAPEFEYDFQVIFDVLATIAIMYFCLAQHEHVEPINEIAPAATT